MGSNDNIIKPPFSEESIQQTIAGVNSGSANRSRIIWIDGVDTLSDIDVNPAPANIPNADGKKSLEVFKCYHTFGSMSHKSRGSNLLRPAQVEASNVWVLTHSNILILQLLARNFQGGISRIVLSSLANIGTGPDIKPSVVRVKEFETCYVEYVDTEIAEGFTLWGFSFVAVTMTYVDIKQVSDGGQNIPAGKRVFKYDYSKGSGALS